MMGHYTTGALLETRIDMSYLFLKVSQGIHWVSNIIHPPLHFQDRSFLSVGFMSIRPDNG